MADSDLNQADAGAPENDPRVLLVGDSPKGEQVKPWHLTTSEFLHAWLDRVSASIALTTYEAGKLVLIGPGLEGKLAVSERDFGQAMALNLTPEVSAMLPALREPRGVVVAVSSARACNGVCTA